MQSISSLAGWEEPDPVAPLPYWQVLIEDAIAYVPPQNRQQSTRKPKRTLIRSASRSAGLRATILYRTAHSASGHLGFAGKVIAYVLSWILRHLYGCTISHRARIYGGLVLPHPHGLVIGPGVIVGPRAWIFHNVTLGGAPDKVGMPYAGSDSRLFAGAVVVGPIRLGDGVFVGANTVVASDVPAGTMVRPAAAVFSPLPNRVVRTGDPGREE